MNKQKVLIISGVGLMAVVVIFLFIQAANKSDKSDTPSNEDAMTNVPSSYTYKDMLEAQGGKGFDLGDTIRRQDPVITEDQPSLADDQEAAAGANVAAAMQDIQNVREAIRKQDPEPSAEKQELVNEDELIRQYVHKQRELNATTAPAGSQAKPTVPVPPPARRGFNTLYSTNTGNGSDKNESISVKGVVLNDIEVSSGFTCSIMLLESAQVNGVQLSKNSVVDGVVDVQTNRVLIRVPGAQINGQLAKTAFSVYGLDGLEGLRVQNNAKSNEVKGTVKDEVSRGVDDVAGAGVLGGVVRVIKSLGSSPGGSQVVKIPGGYKVILKSENSQ